MILLVEEFAVCQTVGGMGKARSICFLLSLLLLLCPGQVTVLDLVKVHVT